MAQFRKVPVVIEATQWFKNGDHPEDGKPSTNPAHMTAAALDAGAVAQQLEGLVVRYYRCPDDPGGRLCNHCSKTMHEHGWIETDEGGHIVCPSDWIITGIVGERYPCKNGVFKATYEPA